MLLFCSGTPTTCSASMAIPWACLHGWGDNGRQSTKVGIINVTILSKLLLATFQKEDNSVQNVRYTLWIPLYPLGFICEGVIALRNIPYFEETDRFVNKPQIVQMPNFSIYFYDFFNYKLSAIHSFLTFLFRFSILLPNKWNVSFYFPNVIRFYLLFGFFPMLYTQMWHMYQLRFSILYICLCY